MDDNFGLGYAMGQDSNSGGGNGGGFGGWGDWIFAILIFAMIFGGGWGFGGGFGGGAGLQGMVTRADINEGFALNNITGGITAIQQGICDSTYALTNAINGGFHGVDKGFWDVSRQLSDCCCENRAAIAQVRYDMATQACDTRNLIQNTTRDLIDNQNANFRALMDYQVNREMREKDAKIAELQNAALTAQQNAFITANQEAQTAELIRRLGRDCPVPAYVVPNPNCCYGNPVGVGYNGNCGGYQFAA